MTPERLEVLDQGKILRVVWADSRTDALDADFLRQNCRSAGARRAQIDGQSIGPSGVSIVAVNPIGNYAVNIEFSDGQSRGIYPWSFLAELGRHASRIDDRILPIPANIEDDRSVS